MGPSANWGPSSSTNLERASSSTKMPGPKVITYPYMAQGVQGHFTKKPEEIGAGDQGHMFGYAINETDQELMPLVHVLATKLGAMLTKVRKNGTCEWLP
ncbi:hypothetical protein L7F22_025411 [Adiantum nelumboides]|nr:hypothetical protein [Adiantum nelumboides]